jgi:hypothetical protein
MVNQRRGIGFPRFDVGPGVEDSWRHPGSMDVNYSAGPRVL